MTLAVVLQKSRKDGLPELVSVVNDCRDHMIQDIENLEEMTDFGYTNWDTVSIFHSNSSNLGELVNFWSDQKAMTTFTTMMSKLSESLSCTIGADKSYSGLFGIKIEGELVSYPFLSLLMWLLRNFKDIYERGNLNSIVRDNNGIEFLKGLVDEYKHATDLGNGDLSLTLYYLKTLFFKGDKLYYSSCMTTLGPADYTTENTFESSKSKERFCDFLISYKDFWDPQDICYDLDLSGDDEFAKLYPENDDK
jgi:hypothetical protein